MTARDGRLSTFISVKPQKPTVILKMDFEKAFDCIEQETIYMMLRKLGFPKVFIQWVKNILETGTSSVLVNGVTDRIFRCKRGVRQGDPLSVCHHCYLCLEQNYCNMWLMIYAEEDS